ncbi:MAG TPA: phosphate/phosphite/phosphonate ABC transporter substrate-binding protein [Gemmataceae bacterium]|jgi:ABC-type phosphate/phosphonate transport system substrate-binding protein|nr:phosphate/phosphite/phosphonate ABC transporter substrate-binding protein [Gemmataceae bacterium]
MVKPILVGAVAYDPRVVPIWEGMRDYFRQAGQPIDYVLFSNYDRQVQALLSRQIDIAWNTNLAWIKVHRATHGMCRALAMRDVDAEFTTIVVVRTDSGIKSLADVKGKRLALGSADSAQAAILPFHFFQQAGVQPEKDCTLLRFDLDVGKHGDTGTSELEVLRALGEGKADVGALGDTTWIHQVAEGRVDTRQIRPIWTSPGYCHCNFTVMPDFPEPLGERWTDELLGMHYGDPRWRGLMDQEGLKRWIRADPAILEGYKVLFDAVERQGLANNWQF